MKKKKYIKNALVHQPNVLLQMFNNLIYKINLKSNSYKRNKNKTTNLH